MNRHALTAIPLLCLDPGGVSSRLKGGVIDWLWSTAVYSSALAVVIGAAGVIRPLRWPHGRSRQRASIIMVAGLALIVAITSVTPSTRSTSTANAIDDFAPSFQFQEHHTIVVQAPPDRVFAAIKSVTADEIALFNLFTTIRRFGRPGPESILNAPRQQPILDVAVRTGFLLLANRPPREVVVGAIVAAPPEARGMRRESFTGDDFKALSQPGFAKATMNFLVTDLGNGATRVDTETRVFATDGAALSRFTRYWRVIFPGSSILRATWLRAVKTKAERRAS